MDKPYTDQTRECSRDTSRLAAFAIYNPNPIVEVGRSGEILYQNPATGKLLQEVGVAETGLEGILPLEFKDMVGACLDCGEGRRRVEVEAHGRWFGWSIYPTPGGQVAYLYGSDLTAIKRAELEQKQFQDQLIQTEKLASLGTLVSGVTHEINNPLYGIMGTAESILDEENLGTIREYARNIVDYSQHIATLVRDFACYARPAALGQDVEVDINERLAEALKMVRRGPHVAQVDVVAEYGTIPLIKARPGEIQQVFVNLIVNALQAMNGVGRLTLTTQCDGQVVTVLVADTGSGIPKDLLRKIFDPFFTTKDPGKGTGLGLSIVHKIVTEKYNGQISVKSEHGKGTTFSLRFPVKVNGNPTEEVCDGNGHASGRG